MKIQLELEKALIANSDYNKIFESVLNKNELLLEIKTFTESNVYQNTEHSKKTYFWLKFSTNVSQKII
jgi:acyl-CoA thioesterase